MTTCLTKNRKLSLSLSVAALFLALTACSSGQQTTTSSPGAEQSPAAESQISGDILIDGSSTVFPVTEAMAEEFQKANSNVRVTVGVSGTGGGFKKFCSGETDISNASRPIKESEIKACEEAGVEYIELPIAFDALSVVVSPKNDWAACLTVKELNKMWEPDAQGKINNWKQIREDFPDKPLNLYGAGTDSGTFDYFTDAINGEEGASRGDYTASEDDNVIVQGVSNDENSIGYFGLAYLEENPGKLKAVKIDDEDPSNGEGCVEPGAPTVADGTYQPLARPIFIYVRKDALEKPQIQAFVDFYVAAANDSLVQEAGYIPLPSGVHDKVQARLSEQKTGTSFKGGSTVGVKLEEVL